MAEAESTNIDRTCLRLAYQYYYRARVTDFIKETLQFVL